jgi:hypothetical protein
MEGSTVNVDFSRWFRAGDFRSGYDAGLGNQLAPAATGCA